MWTNKEKRHKSSCLRVVGTSQVWQRPQQASVVTRRFLHPGFWATKVNSRTAQPRKPWIMVVTATQTAAWPTRRRRRESGRGCKCMLGKTDDHYSICCSECCLTEVVVTCQHHPPCQNKQFTLCVPHRPVPLSDYQSSDALWCSIHLLQQLEQQAVEKCN